MKMMLRLYFDHGCLECQGMDWDCLGGSTWLDTIWSARLGNIGSAINTLL